jgi:hypothetical protein
MTSKTEAVRPILVSLMRSPVALIGSVLTTFSAVLFLILFAVLEFGFKGGLYLGIVAYLFLPALFGLGLILIPLGIWRQRAKERRNLAAGVPAPRAPVIDLNVPRTRIIVLLVLVFSAINVVILSGGTYKGVEVMESSQFCGGACHSVMSPEYTAYQRSPHARVACTECHVGSGADWFVKSKVSGTRQLVALAFNSYARPISTPVHNMRPAEDTCGQCHTSTRYTGARLVVHTHFSPDEKQTEKKTVVLVKVGGFRDGSWEGIHRHVDPARQIRFRSDASRRHVYDVELSEGGKTTVFHPTAAPTGGAADDWRKMDCIDCHNRPTHIYRLANDELDAALDAKQLDRSLPFIKREGLGAIQAAYASADDARLGISRALHTFYASQYPEVAKSDASKVDAASESLWQIYRRNVFPQMKIAWGTYPSFAAHDGCLRCHDNEHVAASGEKISQKCELCHTRWRPTKRTRKSYRSFIRESATSRTSESARRAWRFRPGSSRTPPSRRACRSSCCLP